ncbi:SIR2-like domain-containing protein [Klenkia soli]|uniref:SIR2-like domain-containing protein n=2 Tax=Klenkia soli TaxID=1052260 RepID=A0A1H0Q3L9_9ACTN|nr:SIR2-like domain-containing protein [Klenkia soli]
MDVVFVAYNPADYSAFQSERRKAGDMLSAEQETLARALAERAKSGELALFMGAGTSMSAGLPSWNGLLAALAARVDLPFDAAAWDRLGPLDAAELLRRRAADVHHGEEGALGWLVSEIIAPKKRYGLTHVQLAALHCEQAITTNFDHLYEDAVAAVDGRRPLVVLPGGKSRELAGTSSAGWLLKLHGDVSAPASVVLARRSFVTYDAQRRPLGGVLQSTLLTKHLLVVGASMTDDNVIRLIHEVAELGERSHGSATELGTVISLQRDDLRQQIWKPEFAYLALGERNGDVGRAARELEVFLDRVVLLSETGQAHLISERYAPLLGTDAERRAAASARHLHEEIAGLGGEGWSALRAALEQFGADPT